MDGNNRALHASEAVRIIMDDLIPNINSAITEAAKNSKSSVTYEFPKSLSVETLEEILEKYEMAGYDIAFGSENNSYNITFKW